MGGTLLFAASASAFFKNPAFQIKFLLLLIGIAYHVVVQRNAPKWGASVGVPVVAKLATFAELALWIGVITAAVEIPKPLKSAFLAYPSFILHS